MDNMSTDARSGRYGKHRDSVFVSTASAKRTLRFSAAWHKTILPSGASGGSVDKLARVAIRELSRRQAVSWDEASELLLEGRQIACAADQRYRHDGGKSWAAFILWGLRKELPKRLERWRKHVRRRQPLREDAIEDRRAYSSETLEEAFRPGCYRSVPHDTDEKGEHGGSSPGGQIAVTSLRSAIEDSLHGSEQQQRTERALRKLRDKLTGEEFDLLIARYATYDETLSFAKLAEWLTATRNMQASKSTASRKYHRALTHAQEILLCWPKRLAQLTGTAEPAVQAVELALMGIYYKPTPGAVIVLWDDVMQWARHHGGNWEAALRTADRDRHRRQLLMNTYRGIPRCGIT